MSNSKDIRNGSLNRRDFMKKAGQAAAAGAAVSAIGFPAVLRGASPPPIKLGHIHPLTGFLAFDGAQLQKGAQLAVAEVNHWGGIQSQDGAKLELLDGDSETKPDVAITEMERFNNAGVVAVMGCYQSSVTLVATQQAERLKIPFVVSVSVADQVTGRKFKYTFRTQPKAEQMASQTMRYLNDVARAAGEPVKTIAHLHDNTAFGTGLFAHVKNLAPKYGMEIVLDMPYSPRAADVTTEINKVKFANPDVVLHSGYFNDSIRALRTMRDLRLKAKGIVGLGNAAYSHTQFVAKAGAHSNLVMDGNYRSNPTNPNTKRVADAYKRAYNDEMPTHAVYAYTAVMIVADALERAKSRDRKKLRKALANTYYTDHILPQDAIIYGADGQNVNASAALMQVQNKEVKVVWPGTYAQAKPIFPQRG